MRSRTIRWVEYGALVGVPIEKRPTKTLYEAVGGQTTFARIVDRFYTAVATDPVLRLMYPEDDLGPAAEQMISFNAQYWEDPSSTPPSEGTQDFGYDMRRSVSTSTARGYTKR